MIRIITIIFTTLVAQTYHGTISVTNDAGAVATAPIVLTFEATTNTPPVQTNQVQVVIAFSTLTTNGSWGASFYTLADPGNSPLLLNNFMADYLTFLALARLRRTTALAGMAYTTASSASGSANDKIISASSASGSGSRVGQEWEQHVGGIRVGSWTWDGNAWITSN